VSDEIAGDVKLLKHGRLGIDDTIADGLQFKSNFGEALRESVMHLMG